MTCTARSNWQMIQELLAEREAIEWRNRDLLQDEWGEGDALVSDSWLDSPDGIRHCQIGVELYDLGFRSSF